MKIPYWDGQIRLTIELSDGLFESPVTMPRVSRKNSQVSPSLGPRNGASTIEDVSRQGSIASQPGVKT